MSIKDSNWYDEQWNPITGSRNGWATSKAESFCKRFSGDIRINLYHSERYSEYKDSSCDGYMLGYTFQSDTDNHYLATPFGIAPTLHKYRFNTINERYKSGRNILMCPNSELFGGVPVSWVQKVFELAYNNPKHNYFVISSNLTEMYERLHGFPLCDYLASNFWFGYNMKNNSNDQGFEHVMCYGIHRKANFFLYIENLTKDIVEFIYNRSKTINGLSAVKWIIIEKNSNEELTQRIISVANSSYIPIWFCDKSPHLPRVAPLSITKAIPSEGRKKLNWAKCAKCNAEYEKKSMQKICTTKGRSVSAEILGFICEGCYEEFKRQFKRG